MVVVARRIPDKDIAAIRERARIEEVVGEYVALKPGGVDSLNVAAASALALYALQPEEDARPNHAPHPQ